MTQRFVIFDLDGVLVETEPYWREGFRAGMAHIAGSLGEPVPALDDETLKEYEGGRVPDTLTRLATHFFGDALGPGTARLDGEVATATDIAIKRASELLADDPQAIEPSVQTARALAREGYVLAVASSSAPEFIDAALRAVGLRDVVAGVESAFHLERPKPDPLVYLQALEVVGASSEAAIAIEDSPTGVEAALRAGLRTIWVTKGASVALPESLAGSLRRAPGDDDPWPALVEVAEVSVDDVHDLFEDD